MINQWFEFNGKLINGICEYIWANSLKIWLNPFIDTEFPISLSLSLSADAPVKDSEDSLSDPASDPATSLFLHWGHDLGPESRRAALRKFQYYGYNGYLSDRVSLTRPIPDYRPDELVHDLLYWWVNYRGVCGCVCVCVCVGGGGVQDSVMVGVFFFTPSKEGCGFELRCLQPPCTTNPKLLINDMYMKKKSHDLLITK